MKVRYLTIYFFAFTVSLYTFVEWPLYTFASEQTAKHTVPTFEQTVEQWSVELSESIPSPDGLNGNCLPVAVELQKRIVNTGRIAFIAIVASEDPTTNHALVTYSSEVSGRLDSVIDNGYSTQHKVKPKDFLDSNVFGEYLGTCKDPDPLSGRCLQAGKAW